MARKRRKGSSQRRRPARSRRGGSQRPARNPGLTEQERNSDQDTAGETGPVHAAAAVTPAAQSEDVGADLVAAQPTVAATATERTSWPTRRKRSQMVELPVEELDHVRGDLARIGVLSLGMVVILVVLTFVLR